MTLEASLEGRLEGCLEGEGAFFFSLFFWPQFHEKTTRDRRKNENCGGRGTKKREILGPPPFGPTLRAPIGGVRGLCIAKGRYSSFCGCAVDLVLGGFNHKDDHQDRGDEEMRESVDAHERGRDQSEERQRTVRHDDMWMNMFL